MGPKNKQVKNAFFFYMEDLIPQLKREGRVFPNGKQDVVPIAHPRWKSMSEKDRQRYEDMAKEHKRRMRGQVGDAIRQDNQGNIIARRKDAVSEYESQREKEILDYMKQWPTGDGILDYEFHFLDVQTLCKTEDNQYLLVEMACVEFTLRDGIKRYFHQMLKPMAIPTGMRYSCQSNSLDTHKIPCEGAETATDDWVQIQVRIENFVNYNKTKGFYPPFFALRENWDQCDYALDFIYEHTRTRQTSHRMQVYELENLMLGLLDRSRAPLPTKSIITDRLTTNSYDYTLGLKCEFHEELDCKFCCLLNVRRFCFAIAETFSGIYEIDLKPNQHQPGTVSKKSYIEKIDPEPSAAFQSLPQRQTRFSAPPSGYSTPSWRPSGPPSGSVSGMSTPRPSWSAPSAGSIQAVLRPPGAADIDYRSTKASVVRPSPPPDTQAEPEIMEMVDLLSAQDLNTEPSLEKRELRSQSRIASWLPPGITPGSSRSWSRSTTPASTPRATPRATPLATPVITPLMTPHGSPPRNEGSYLSNPMFSINSSESRRPPPGLSTPPGLGVPPGLERVTHGAPAGHVVSGGRGMAWGGASFGSVGAASGRGPSVKPPGLDGYTSPDNQSRGTGRGKFNPT